MATIEVDDVTAAMIRFAARVMDVPEHKVVATAIAMAVERVPRQPTEPEQDTDGGAPVA